MNDQDIIDFLKAEIRALDYYVFHRTAGMDSLLYESHNDLCPEHTVERRKREAQRLLTLLSKRAS